MYNLPTLREITVLDLPVTEITVEVVDLPLYLDMSDFEVDAEANTTTDFPDLSPDQLPPPPEVVYVPWDTFPDLSPAQLGLHVTHL